MPLYEYRCQKCGALVERIQKFSDPPLTTCEKCNGPLERVLSSPAIQFKGSGWYVTDYARKSSPPERGREEPAASGDKKEVSSPSTTSVSKETKPGSNKQ